MDVGYAIPYLSVSYGRTRGRGPIRLTNVAFFFFPVISCIPIQPPYEFTWIYEIQILGVLSAYDPEEPEDKIFVIKKSSHMD